MRAAILAATIVLWACGSSAAPGGGAPRIVSLSPSATEIVAALGASDQLVGVDDYSSYPAVVARLPKVGSYLTPNLEVIVQLRPTLVIVDDVHGEAARALEGAGLTTLECPIHALPDVEAGLKKVGAALGRTAEADKAIDAIESAKTRALDNRPTGKRPRVLAVIDRDVGGVGNLVAAGPGSYLDELLALTGGENVLSSSGTRYPKISLEEILRAQPDVVIDVSHSAIEDHNAAWTGVQIPAVANRRVRTANAAYLQAPSPRLPEALDAVAAMLR